jgi:hypothetical protein
LDSVTAVLPDPAEPTTTTGHGRRRTASWVSSKKIGLSSSSKVGPAAAVTDLDAALSAGAAPGSQRSGTTSPDGSVAGSAGGSSASSLASSTTAPRRKRDFS